MAFSFDQRERRIKSHGRTPEIPFDLVIEILRRLPAKSLVKFKSVSKIWSSFICSRNFTNSFLRVTSSPPRLYMSLKFFDNTVK
ncbi:F-box/kelch-repeat protein [Cardamine amara subsp. amara]|uniref:F-box/kelch-repeat protein n=1 Tax=Cardamine amara subsp. amara TaxID=228776 RepID=A0ABD1AXI8_CARAN